MLRMMALVLTLAFANTVLGANTAQAQPIDEWHYIDEDSVLHTDIVNGLHGAGVIQSDLLFAMLYLGAPDNNGVVSVVLPTTEPAAEISSTLIATNGQRFERLVTADDLDIARVSEGSHAYSFSITALDVDLFKSARSWRLAIDDQEWVLTLTGSRRAITEAEKRYTRMIEQLQADAGTSAKTLTSD